MVLMIIIAGFIVLLGIVMLSIDSVEESNEPGRINLECTRNCVHTDCEYHAGNVSGYKTRTDLMWSPACPYYTYRDDLDDPEG